MDSELPEILDKEMGEKLQLKFGEWSFIANLWIKNLSAVMEFLHTCIQYTVHTVREDLALLSMIL